MGVSFADTTAATPSVADRTPTCHSDRTPTCHSEHSPTCHSEHNPTVIPSVAEESRAVACKTALLPPTTKMPGYAGESERRDWTRALDSSTGSE